MQDEINHYPFLTLKLYGWPLSRSGDIYAIVPVNVLAVGTPSTTQLSDRSFAVGRAHI